MKVLRKIVVVILVAATFVALLYLKIAKKPEIAPQEKVSGVNVEDSQMVADTNGDGVLETVVLISSNEDGQIEKIEIVNSSGDIIATTPKGITFPQPLTDSFKVFKLETQDSRDFFSFDFIAGPHQSERMFFGVQEDKIYPVCFKEKFTTPEDCLFYQATTDGLFVKDLDSDGKVELVEVADEYPLEATLSPEEEKAVEQAFSDLNVAQSIEGAKKVARREKAGRGRPVVWSIYSYNGNFFAPQTGNNYENYFILMQKEGESLIAKSDISRNSSEFIEFARKFWTQR